ncbi:MAG: virulence protein RhuM/Fic/DOC family protein [Candidatus Portnoybacteria bacterium]|nr:virulence protein RhuM/Fic/DOC family protein [Candidatus Portnoybacteria bacterium]
MKKPTDIIIYQAKNGAIELKMDVARDTFWLTQQQVAEVFDVQKAAISKHTKNIFDSGELKQKSTVSKMETVQIEGSRKILRTIEYYNLDLVLSIGYRVNSKKATLFRQWATRILRGHITKGFTINKNVIKNNYAEFQKAIENIKYLLPTSTNIDHADVLELISAFADTWLSLDAYDKSYLPKNGTTKKQVIFATQELLNAFFDFKKELTKKNLASDLFGQERVSGSIEGIVGAIFQSFDKKDLYSTIEEKAAHLLYFMVKNHPFIDGNKRGGAYAFIWFLKKSKILNSAKLTPATLTALTLFVAESNPKDKDRVIGLILALLKKK